MITAFIRATRRAYDHLRDACERDSCYASWACLILLELRILARHFSQSPEVRRAFYDNVSREMQDFLAVLGDVGGEVFPDILLMNEALLEQSRNRKTGRQPARYKRPPTSRLAAELGFAEEYKQMKRLTLAWAHPTALSVLSVESEVTRKATQELLFYAGGKYVNQILQDLIPLARNLLTKPESESFLM